MDSLVVKLLKEDDPHQPLHLTEKGLFRAFGFYTHLLFIPAEGPEGLLRAIEGNTANCTEQSLVLLPSGNQSCAQLARLIDPDTYAMEDASNGNASVDVPFCIFVLVQDRFNADSVCTDSHRCHIDRYRDALRAFMDAGPARPGEALLMDALDTLGCADHALIFRTNSLTLAQAFLHQLFHDNQVVTTYSIAGISARAWKDGQAGYWERAFAAFQGDDLQVSLRLMFRSGCDVYAGYERAKQAHPAFYENLRATALMGNYHWVLSASKNGYDVLRAIAAPDGPLSIHNEDSFVCACAETARVSLRIGLEYGMHTEGEAPARVLDDSPSACPDPEVTSALLSALDGFWRQVTDSGGNGYANGPQLYSEYGSHMRSLRSTISRQLNFFHTLERMSRQHINREIWHYLHTALEALTDRVRECTYWWNAMCRGEDARELVDVSADEFVRWTLSETQECVQIIADQIRNTVQLQRGYLEDRGLSRPEVSATAKLSIAYHEYAQRCCEMLRKTDMESELRQDSFFFFVCFDITEQPAVAIKRFAFLPLFHLEEGAERMNVFVTLHIAQQSVFDVMNVRRIIMHECGHYAGFRDREKRRYAVANVLSLWLRSCLMDPIRDIFVSGSGDRDNMQDLFSRYINDATQPHFDVEEAWNEAFGEARKRIDSWMVGLSQTKKPVHRLERCYAAHVIEEFDSKVLGLLMDGRFVKHLKTAHLTFCGSIFSEIGKRIVMTHGKDTLHARNALSELRQLEASLERTVNAALFTELHALLCGGDLGSLLFMNGLDMPLPKPANKDGEQPSSLLQMIEGLFLSIAEAYSDIIMLHGMSSGKQGADGYEEDEYLTLLGCNAKDDIYRDPIRLILVDAVYFKNKMATLLAQAKEDEDNAFALTEKEADYLSRLKGICTPVSEYLLSAIASIGQCISPIEPASISAAYADYEVYRRRICGSKDPRRERRDKPLRICGVLALRS